MAGLSDVSARIVRYHDGRAPDLVQRKYETMAASPFAFYRGSCQLFLDAWPKRTPLNDAPPIWSCGDLHFENLGCYKGDNRLVYFDINDFDEAALLPASWDLVRFTASVLVGAASLHVSAAASTSLAKDYLIAYDEALASGKARWIERDTATGMTRELLDAVRTRKRKELLDERTKKSGAHRVIRVDGVKALDATKADVARITTIVERHGAALGKKDFYKVLDVARRVAGCGSLGLARWIVLVKGKGSPHGNYLLDIKDARQPASTGHSPFRQPKWKTEAERIVTVQRRVQAVSPALLAVVTMRGEAMVLRELQPLQDRMRMGSWGGNLDDLRNVMTTMGRITAWAALRASGRDGSATADELIAFAAERGWRNEVIAVARRVAKQTMSEWRDFSADVKAGRVQAAG